MEAVSTLRPSLGAPGVRIIIPTKRRPRWRISWRSHFGCLRFSRSESLPLRARRRAPPDRLGARGAVFGIGLNGVLRVGGWYPPVWVRYLRFPRLRISGTGFDGRRSTGCISDRYCADPMILDVSSCSSRSGKIRPLRMPLLALSSNISGHLHSRLRGIYTGCHVGRMSLYLLILVAFG